MKILILYYSGVGNTKMIAKRMFEIWNRIHDVTITSIEKLSKNIDIAIYDALVIGFPTIHASPAMPIISFIERTKCLQVPIPTFLFTTCGLYPANTLRIFASKCVKKNMLPVLTRSYRCAATDGVLMAPFMNIWFKHERKLYEKITIDTSSFIKQRNKLVKVAIPRFKLYSILNYPNKFFGQRFSPQIYTHKAECVSCGKCINDCPTQSMRKGDEGYPLVNNENCIHCYRCIHHCPKKALSLSKKHMPLKTLYY